MLVMMEADVAEDDLGTGEQFSYIKPVRKLNAYTIIRGYKNGRSFPQLSSECVLSAEFSSISS
jgi:hypothetical protein